MRTNKAEFDLRDFISVPPEESHVFVQSVLKADMNNREAVRELIAKYLSYVGYEIPETHLQALENRSLAVHELRSTIEWDTLKPGEKAEFFAKLHLLEQAAKIHDLEQEIQDALYFLNVGSLDKTLERKDFSGVSDIAAKDTLEVKLDKDLLMAAIKKHKPEQLKAKPAPVEESAKQQKDDPDTITRYRAACITYEQHLNDKKSPTKLDQNKLVIVRNLKNILDEEKDGRIERFHQELAKPDNRKVLTKRPDNAFFTFVKNLGIKAGKLLTSPIGGNAHRYFAEKARSREAEAISTEEFKNITGLTKRKGSTRG